MTSLASLSFEFATAGRILFGKGTAEQIPALARALGKRFLVVTGRGGRFVPAELEGVQFPVSGEPTLELGRAGVQVAREHGCDAVIAIGGGSAIDAGKAIAALTPNSGEPLDYLEVIGQGRALENPPLPVLAAPTTAGTGSEVTRNAVLGSPEHRVKASLRSPLMLPRVAVVDPELTRGLPAHVAAATGLDALTQLIEPYVSSRANPIADAFCVAGIPLAAEGLTRLASSPAEMSLAALWGGLALANAGLGVVHGLAGPIGGAFPAPHGAICAAILPHGMRANIAALRARAPEHPSLARHGEVARLVTGRGDATPDDGVEWVSALVESLRIPPLRTYGICNDDVPKLIEQAAKASSMKGNPIALTLGELADVLRAAI